MRSLTIITMRPATLAALEEASRGNKSYAIRQMVEEYLANPYPLQKNDDTMIRFALSSSDEFIEKIKAAAKEQGLSTMIFLRLILEHNLHRPQKSTNLRPSAPSIIPLLRSNIEA